MLSTTFLLNIVSLPHVFKSHSSIHVILKNSASFRDFSIFISPEDTTGCIYDIPCHNCDKFYIGINGRPFFVRVKEQQNEIRTGNLAGALSLHTQNCIHRINFKICSVVTHFKDFVHRNLIESASISHIFDQNINNSYGIYNLNNFIIMKIVSTYIVT